MARYSLSDQDYNQLVAAVWKALDGPCWCKLGLPCKKAKMFSDTLASILASETTLGHATVEVWTTWREFGATFRTREPLEDR